MLDGLYQSIMCFFMPYLLYSVPNFQRPDGRGIDDRPRFGVLVASAAVISSNVYILLNTYRWDWLTVLINIISNLLIFFWTGVYTSSIASAQFYKAAAEVYSSLSFWVVLLMTVVICLLPRFVIKAFQKVFFPRDVDIIREQVVMGKFKHLKPKTYGQSKSDLASGSGTSSDGSAASSDVLKPIDSQAKRGRDYSVPDEERPIYPPSIAPTTRTHNPRSQNGSTGTEYAESWDFNDARRPQTSDPAQPGLHVKADAASMMSNDFPGGAPLTRVESVNNAKPQSPHSPLKSPNDPVL